MPSPSEPVAQDAPRIPIDPRAAALLVLWAIRYSAPRLLTGASSWPQVAASVLAPYLTQDERAAICITAITARSLAQAAADDPEQGPPGLGLQEALDRVASWQALVDRLQELGGDGKDGPVLEWWGHRTLALTALSAVRRLSDGVALGNLSQDEREAVASVADACAACAGEYSPSDRVLIMRDLAYAAEAAARMDEPFPQEWAGLYARLAAMPLDEEYRAMNRLPAVIEAS
jgi:hypothetical protein